MPTGSRHLHGSFYVLLAFYIGKVVYIILSMRLKLCPCIHLYKIQFARPLEEVYHLHKGIGGKDFQFIHHGCFACILPWHNKTFEPQFPYFYGNG